MAAKLSPMALWGLVKELRIAAEDTRPLAVSGPLAAQLEKELSRGAAPGAVRVDGRPEDAAVFVRVLAGAPTPEDEELLRAADRAKVPVLVVQTGTEVYESRTSSRPTSSCARPARASRSRRSPTQSRAGSRSPGPGSPRGCR